MPEPLSDADYARFRSLIEHRTGLDFAPPRRRDLHIGLERTQHSLQLTGLDALYTRLAEGDSAAWDTAIDALAVCETHFYRNAPQFDALRDHILPGLIRQRQQSGLRTLRLWSAGCASGEEAYSLAILLRETLPDYQAWRLDILGTDINNRSLMQARRGLYHNWSFREAVAQSWRERYFWQDETAAYQLRDDIRQMVRFAHCSLLDDTCPSTQGQAWSFDVVLCRNVTLYLGEDARRRVYATLLRALAPGGWLITGHADPAPARYTAFAPVQVGGLTFYQRAIDPASAPAPPQTAPLPPANPTASEAEAHYRRGRWHADRQDWAQALDHCRRAVEIEPTHAQAHYTLALIHHSRGDDAEAVEALRRVIYLDRAWALPRFTLAGIYRQAGQIERARRELRHVIAITAPLPPDTPIPGGEGLTAARLHAAAERQLQALGA